MRHDFESSCLQESHTIPVGKDRPIKVVLWVSFLIVVELNGLDTNECLRNEVDG